MKKSTRSSSHWLSRLFSLFSILVWLWYAPSQSSYAQRDPTAVVNVQVADSNEGGIFQAEVRLFVFGQGNPEFRNYTDGSGRVTFNGVRRGSYYLEVVKAGYESTRENVDVNPGAVESFSVRLRQLADTGARGGRPGAVTVRGLSVPAEARKEFEQGEAKLRDDPAQSIQHFRNAIKKFPGYAEAYAMLGLAYMRNRENDDAIAALNKAIELDSKLAIARTLLGKIYLEEKKFADAEKSLLESIRLDSSSWNSHYELARCYFNLGKMDQALSYARRARDLPGAASTTHLLLVDIYLRKPDERSALKELEEFAKADPQSPFMPRVQRMIDKLRKPK